MNITPNLNVNKLLTGRERQKNKKDGEYFNNRLLGKRRGQKLNFLPQSALDFEVFYVILYMHINLLFASAHFFIIINKEALRRFRRKHMKLFKLKKVLAGFLAFVMVAGYTSSVSAATSTSTNSSSSSSSNFDEALEQLNDATWSEYYWLVEEIGRAHV